MKPKFSVGETVIVVCKDLPQFDGTAHVITDISEVTFTDHNVTMLCYKLGFTYEWQGDKNYPYWRESCLKKKHTPSEFSFDSLMDNLKLPQSA